MINGLLKGDILTAPSGIVVQGCNAQGVMGSGLALQIKTLFPDVFKEYKSKHESSGLLLGDVVICPPKPPRNIWIANAITQEFYGRNPNVRYVDYDAVRTSFSVIADLARRENLEVHYPQIGAGLGNGDWGVLSKIIEEKLDGIPSFFWEFVPNSIPAPKTAKTSAKKS